MDWHFKHLIDGKIIYASSVFHDGIDELLVQTVDGQMYKLEAAEKDGVSCITVRKV